MCGSPRSEYVSPSSSVRAPCATSRVSGGSAPLTVGSAGKVLLAFLPPSEQRDVLDRLSLDPGSAKTIPDEKALKIELANVRRQGWAQSFGDRVLGAGAFSAPVFAGKGRPLAALSVLGPAERFGPETRGVPAGSLSLPPHK